MENRELYKDISEIKERTASVETKIDLLVESNKKIDEVRDLSINAINIANSAHTRLDRIDKWIFAIGSTVILAIVGAVISLVMI